MQQTCRNCGKPVGSSDITCPHCGALLAAYASPTGSTTTATWDASAPDPDAIPPVRMDEPAPAAKIVIPDEVDTGSSAPRPLFDTNVTIEELKGAAESDHDETLVVVAEQTAASKPVVFKGPDYARPPSHAEPVPIIEDADAELIARPAEEPHVPAAPAPRAPTGDEPAAPGRESWLADAHEVSPTAARRAARRAREVADRATTERGQTEAYLRKLHADTGFESSKAQLTNPINTVHSTTIRSLARDRTSNANDNEEESSRKLAWKWLIFSVCFMAVTIAMIIGDGLRGNVLALLLVLFFFVPSILNLLKRVTKK